MSDEQQDDGGILTASVTIKRTYYPDEPADEADTIEIHTTGSPTSIEVLGMLEFAKAYVGPYMRDCDCD